MSSESYTANNVGAMGRFASAGVPSATMLRELPGASIPQKESFDLVIICTKRHEFASFQENLRLAAQQRNINELKEAQTNGGYSWLTFSVDGKSIVVVSFGQVQGPVECASRTVEVYFLFKPKAVAMSGIAGGLRLGEVVIATAAFAPEVGRTQRFSEDSVPENSTKCGADYYLLHEDSALAVRFGKDGENFAIIDEFLAAFSSSYESSFIVKKGRFASYSAVRNDCSLLLQTNPLVHKNCVALEMEAYAFFKVSNLLQIPVLAVVKGISDVGLEKLESIDGIPDDSYIQHNRRELEKVADFPAQTEPSAADNLRKLYRKIASQNAARVLLDLTLFWARAPQSSEPNL